MAASKTFLELVNRALVESKVTLDQLTPSNFAAPTGSIMYDHFKTWINTAYEELALARPDWHFQQERATVPVYPRLHLSGILPHLDVGNTLQGNSSGVVFTIVGNHSGEGDPSTNRTVSVVFADAARSSRLILNETFSVISPYPEAQVATLLGWGFYDFKTLLPDLAYIVQDSVKITETVANAVANGRNQSSPVLLLPYVNFSTTYPYRQWETHSGTAQAITQTPQGSFELYPRLDHAYLLSFDYTKQHVPMVIATDVPSVIPPQYQLYIMWKAVLEYADFDGNPKVFARAKKHIDEYRYWLERDEMPRPRMQPIGFRVSR